MNVLPARIIKTVLLAVGLLGASPVMAAEPAVGSLFGHDLAAPDQTGKARSLQDLQGKKGMVVFFVRSADWCPFCRGQLADMNKHLPRFTALGYNVVSVSVDEVGLIAAFSKQQRIGYTMLADPLGKINLDLGIRDEQYPLGSAAFGVPRPTLYVVDGKGVVRLRYREPTFRTRPNLDLVLRDVAALVSD